MRKRKKLLTRILSLVLALTIMIPEQAAYALVPDRIPDAEPDIAHKHSYHYVVTKEPTCTEDGYKEMVCDCGSNIGGQKIAALGHSNPLGTEKIKEANCAEKGKIRYYCKRDKCNYEYYKDIPQNNKHGNYVWKTISSPDCEHSGKEELTCVLCGDVQQTKYPSALGHNHTIEISRKNPTCIENGYRILKCSRCQSDTKKEILPASTKYHVYEWKEIYPSTETRAGKDEYTCKICGDVIGERYHDPLGKEEPSEKEPEKPVTPSAEESSSKDTDTADQKETTNTTTNHVVDPVNAYTGDHEIDFGVMSCDGKSDITVGLSYKSGKSIESTFGKGFSWNYESFYKETDEGIRLYHDPASYVLYTYDVNKGFYVTDAIGSEPDELVKRADNTVTLKCNGKTFDYNKDGKLVKVTEKTGESVSVEYKENEINLVDNISGQRIYLYLNDKGYVSKVSNGASAEAFFEYDSDGYLTKYTDSDGFITTYTYDEDGRVLTGSDNDGNTYFENTYDEDGRASIQKDALGNVSVISYEKAEDGSVETVLTDREGNKKYYSFDKDGRLLSLKDEEGNTESYTYDSMGNCTSSTDAKGNTSYSEYDSRHNLVKSTDKEGNVTLYSYDSKDNLLKITYADGSEAAFTYDSKNRLVSTVDTRGLETFNQYDENGYLIRTISGNRSLTYTYENGNVKTITDAMGNVTTYSYDENGHLCETVGTNGAVTKKTVSPYGSVLDATDALGNVTATTYNCVDKPLTSTDAEGNVVTCKYDDRQLLTETIDAKGNSTKYYYDSEERLVKTVYADGSYTENTYDATGRLIKTTDAEGNAIDYSYDAAGNVIKENDKNGNVSTFTYTKTGKVASKTDANGNTTSYTYDNRDRIVKETYPDGGVLTYTYNNAGDILSVTDPLGNVTSYEYDVYGQRTKLTDPNGNVTTYVYDLNGNLIKTTDALGETVVNEYDSENRLIATKVNADVEVNFPEIEVKEESSEAEDMLKDYQGSFTVKWSNEATAISTTPGTGNITHVHYGTSGLTSPSGCYKEAYSSYEVVGEEEYDKYYGNCYYDEATGTWKHDGYCVRCGSYSCAGHGMYRDVYGYVTRYKCTHGGETTGKIEISPSGSNLAAKVTYTNGTTYAVAAYSWKYNGTVVSTGSTCPVGDPGTYTLTVTVKDKYSGVNQSFSASCNAKYNVSAVSSKNADGSVSVTMSSFGKTSAWSMDGGTTWQTGNVFTIDKNGTYIFAGKNAKGEIVRKALTISNAETDNENGTFVYLSGMKGVGSATADSGDIDISGHKYLDITTINCAVSIDGEVKYDYSGANANDEEIHNRFDVTDANTLRITAKSESGTAFKGFVAGVTKLEVLDSEPVIEVPVTGKECITEVPTGKQVAVTTYEYDLKGQLIAVTDPNGNRSTKAYDKRGNTVKVTDALGNDTTYTYDENGNLTSATDAKNRTETYSVNNLNQVVSTTDALGLVTSYSYDKNGRMTSSVNPMGGVSTGIFDNNGNTLALVGPEGGTTSFTYDANGNVSSKSTIEDNSVKYTYNDLNLVESLTNAREQGTTYEYDLCGRVVKAAFAEGDVLYTYDANGNVLTVTDDNGTVKRTYDALNRVTSVTDTNGNIVGYEYDDFGNLRTLIYPDETCVSYIYDLCGNILTVTDFEGRVTSYSYDALNREIETRNANGNVVTKEYDEVSNLVKMTECKSDGSLLSETLYEYDADDRLIKETETVKKYAYEYTYDDLGRVLKRTTKNPETGEVTAEEDFTLDGAGNITSATVSGTDKTMSYNSADNRIESLNGSDFVFDNDGNLISGKLSGKDVNLTYDSRNRLTAYGDTDRYTYDSEDYRTESKRVEYVSNIELSDITITVPGDLDPIIGGGGGSNPKPEQPIRPIKPVKPVTPLLPDPDPKPTPSINSDADVNDVTYSTDDNFVTGDETDTVAEPVNDDVSENDVSENNEGPADTSEIVFIEETVTEENVTEENVTEESLTEEISEEVSEDVFEESTEDSDEAVTEESEETSEEVTETEGPEAEEPETEEIEAEDTSSSLRDKLLKENQRTETTASKIAGLNAGTQGKITIGGSGFGTGTDLGSGLGSNATLNTRFNKEIEITTSYCYDRENKNLLVTTDSDGTIVKYVYGNGLISSYETTTETTEYQSYSYDLRGSVTTVSDENGTVTAEYSYSTYGERTVIEGKASVLGYCARDGVLTETNGLIYMRARYYSTELMRFINEDIITGDISNSNSLNRYAYVQGNPATMIDPFGLEPDKSGNKKSKSNIRIEQAAAVLKNLTLETCEIIFALCSLTGGVSSIFFIPEMEYAIANHSEGSQHMNNLIYGVENPVYNQLLEEVFNGDRDTYQQYEFMIPSLINGTLGLDDAVGFIKDSVASFFKNGKGVSQNSYTAPVGGGGITDSISINGKEITFGHGGRHLDGYGLNIDEVNKILAETVSKLGLSQGDFYKGQVIINGIVIEFTSYGVSDSVTNIGTYYPK